MNHAPKPLTLLALLLLGIAFMLPALAGESGNPARLSQLVDYVGVDYAAAVQNGEIIDEFEYGEMQEFTRLIRNEIDRLPPDTAREQLQSLVEELARGIDSRTDPAVIAATAQRMTSVLLQSPALTAVPARLPDPDSVRPIYQNQCAGCHGISGQGNGPLASGHMNPAPTDFTDEQRARARSLYGLYNTITLGVEGTAMPPFGQLTADQRWSLAFLVGGMHASADTLERGQQAWQATPEAERPGLREVTTGTLRNIQQDRGENTAALYAWLRTQPAKLAINRADPLSIAMAGVRQSLQHYAGGEQESAHDAAVDAYLEGFELAEAALSTSHPDLVRDIETSMTRLRVAIRANQPESEIAAAGQQTLDLLQQARDYQDTESLSPGVAFLSALVILLREGLEAILVLGAMAALLNRTGRSDALPWLHGGWIAALLAGLVTWAVSTFFITISGATREITEGVTALLAAGILFYIGFWMHNRMSARRWQEYLQTTMQRTLGGRGRWSLAGIAFIAVYREVFETVLFFQALFAQVTLPASERSLVTGAAVGLILIAVLAWVIFRFSVRLPLKQFFMATTAVMIGLSVIFAGKGVAALQEAGKLPIDPVGFPRIDFLGIYPTLQTLGIQAAVLGLALILLAYGFRSSRPKVSRA
ncbi:cytochrome c/FTR1 family iron permease [Elongatibacter sediminis]|uniref:Cytochrome c/FTR1 family iron permease n=1 Tax=Elongatibacter sediminis TaxID=3119006 RepID=A0AAW9R4U0_9GAMM